jgi:hypothetical protein
MSREKSAFWISSKSISSSSTKVMQPSVASYLDRCCIIGDFKSVFMLETYRILEG